MIFPKIGVIASLVVLVGCQGPAAVEPAPVESLDSEAEGEPPPVAEGPDYLNWEYGPIVLSSETLDFQPVDVEALLLPDGRIRLWSDGVGKGEIRSFTSEDGVTFVPDDVPPIIGTFASVVELPAGGYRMYVTRFVDSGEDPEVDLADGSRVFSLFSDDALTWAEEPGERAVGYESSVAVLVDGRTLMAVRRDSAEIPQDIWCNSPAVTAIWFLVSDDGLTFADVGAVVDGVTTAGLEGRAYGVEFARTGQGELLVHFEGCLPAFFASVDEQSLTVGESMVSPLRGQGVYDHYGFEQNIGGAGGDATFITVDGELRGYISLRDGKDSEMSEPGGEERADVRQRVALVTTGSVD